MKVPRLPRNEEWIDRLESDGTLAEKDAWHPWYAGGKSSDRAPSGYATSYTVSGGAHDFSFATIRLAGHMVRRRRRRLSVAAERSPDTRTSEK